MLRECESYGNDNFSGATGGEYLYFPNNVTDRSCCLEKHQQKFIYKRKMSGSSVCNLLVVKGDINDLFHVYMFF